MSPKSEHKFSFRLVTKEELTQRFVGAGFVVTGAILIHAITTH